MNALRLEAISRGVSARSACALLAAIAVAVLAASLAFQMRTPADRLLAGPTLDSTVLVGLVLPVTVLARTLNNSIAWMVATSPRNIFLSRAIWMLALFGTAIAIDALIAWSLSEAQLPQVVFWAALVLFDLAVVSTILFGANLAWVLPGAVALVCSIPGLVPLRYNYLVRADQVQEMASLAVALGSVAVVAYIALDEYGLRRTARLVERQDGVLAE